MEKVLILLLSVTLLACAKYDIVPNPDGEDFKVYTIKEGDHSPGNNLKFSSENHLEFQVKFDESAIYNTLSPKNQGDINKIYGLSDCGNDHHTNSARFGWRWYDDELQIFAYCYVNGERYSEFMGAIDLNEVYDLSLTLEEGRYIFKLDNEEVTIPRGCEGGGSSYFLFPYFGGDETAPHDINIYITV